MAEFQRGQLVARSFSFVIAVAAVLLSTGASIFASPKNNSAPLAGKPDTAAQERQLERQTAPLARYFTINQVLAKLDNQNANTASGSQPVQLAALDMSAPVTGVAAGASASGEEPFGLVTFRAPEGQLWVKWRKLGAEIDAEARVLTQCKRDFEGCTNPAAREYLTLIDGTRRLPDHAKIERINRAINAAVRYTSDQDQYGVPDQWSAPLATLGTGKGDCEDYAIAKYVALRDAGFSADDLRLVIVRDRVARQDHAVTGVRQNGRWLMLDNRHEVLLERKDAWHFTPLFALDQQGVKLFAAPYGTPPATIPAQVASGSANATEPASTQEPGTPNAEALGLRLDTFEPPQLRGGL